MSQPKYTPKVAKLVKRYESAMNRRAKALREGEPTAQEDGLIRIYRAQMAFVGIDLSEPIFKLSEGI